LAEHAPAPEPETEDWASILDRLETEISLAFAGESSGWQPPADPGPIPEDLIQRATRILSAHQEAAVMLTASRATTGRHLAAIDSVPDSTRRPPALLDLQG
jgi:hypothetical protein